MFISLETERDTPAEREGEIRQNKTVKFIQISSTEIETSIKELSLRLLKMASHLTTKMK